MKKSQWNEECIQYVLQQMPMVKDERSKEEVYRQVSLARKKERVKVWLIPSIASIDEVLLFVYQAFQFLSPFRSKNKKNG